MYCPECGFNNNEPYDSDMVDVDCEVSYYECGECKKLWVVETYKGNVWYVEHPFVGWWENDKDIPNEHGGPY